MSISLRSHLIAGTTAIVGATAIAMGPVSPAVQVPSLQVSRAAAELAAYANPLTAAFGSLNLITNYLLNPTYATGAGGGLANWGANIVMLPGTPIPNVPDAANTGLLAFPTNYNSVGFLSQFLNDPFPALTQIASNALGYANTLVTYGGAALANLLNLVWLVPATGLLVIQDLAALNIPLAVADLTAAFTTGITLVSNAATNVLNGAVNVFQTIATRATAVGTAIVGSIGTLPLVVSENFQALSFALTGAFANISTAVGTGVAENVWNAVVANLLGPTGIPGVLINQVLGGGVLYDPTGTATFAPSLRSVLQGTGGTIAGALTTPGPVPPAPVAAIRTSARGAAPASSAASADDSTAKKPAAQRAGARSGAAKARAGR